MPQPFRFPRSATSGSITSITQVTYEDDTTNITKEYDEEELAQDSLGNGEMSLYLLIASTCGLGGLQVVWSVILSQGAPFLVSLGLSKSLTSLVWVAGPLSGVIIQPLMGALSDRSRISWGRRRPFILGGAIGTISALVFLAWLQEITKGLTRLSYGDTDDDNFGTAVIILAILGIYVLNISIQPLQMGLRAAIIENCPRSQQEQASSWASRLTGIGNIIGYLAGITNLPKIIPLFFLTQFQGLCLLASVALAIGVGMSCIAITEQNPEKLLMAAEENPSISSYLRRLGRVYRSMPWKIRRVCTIQFCAWLGWFPVLFYSTTYINDLYSKELPLGYDTTAFHVRGVISEKGIRIGSFASLIFAVIALFLNVILPFVVSGISPTEISGGPQATNVWGRKPTMLQAWTASHLLFAIATFSTVFIGSRIGGIIIIGSLGLSWALTLWAPYAIIGIEISMTSSDTENNFELAKNDAGLILSLHNIAISAPQILSAICCSGIFWLANIMGSTDATGWTFRFGGLAALAAAWLSRGLSREF